MTPKTTGKKDKVLGKPCKVCFGEKERGARYYCNRCNDLMLTIYGGNTNIRIAKAQVALKRGQTVYKAPEPTKSKQQEKRCLRCEWNSQRGFSDNLIYCFWKYCQNKGESK